MKILSDAGKLLAVIGIVLFLSFAASGAKPRAPKNPNDSAAIKFDPEQRLGNVERNPPVSDSLRPMVNQLTCSCRGCRGQCSDRNADRSALASRRR